MAGTNGALHFYSGSKAAPAGHGAPGESPPELRHGDGRDVLPGGLPPDCRTMLSNFASFPKYAGRPFEVDMGALCAALVAVNALGGMNAVPGSPATAGVHAFTTAEHAFHFVKLALTGHGDEALVFALGSGSALASSEDGGVVKKAGGRHGVRALGPEERAFWASLTWHVLKHLTLLKFSPAYPVFNDVLCATGAMALVHAYRLVWQEWDWLYELRAQGQRARGVVF